MRKHLNTDKQAVGIIISAAVKFSYGFEDCFVSVGSVWAQALTSWIIFKNTEIVKEQDKVSANAIVKKPPGS